MTAPSFTYSGNVYTGAAAGTVDFALTSTVGNAIAYLEPSHIHVYKSANQGTTWTELTRPSQWDFVTNGTVARLVTGIATGDWVKVQRITPSGSSYVTFQASSLLTADQLNSDTLFNTYLNQEQYDQGATAAAAAATAISDAAAATAAATAATASAASATSTANAASASAATALSNSTTALSNSSTALSNSASAVSTANSAVSTANSAVSTANSAVSTANTASSNATAALNAVAASLQYVLVANVAAIPASPVDAYAVEVANSTGIESFSPLANRPAGFVGDTGLSVRMQYSASGSTWNWLNYFANDSETRYLKLSGGTLTGQLKADDSTSVAAPVYSFDGDTNTGLARTGPDELALVTGGTARLTFDSGGNASFTNSVTIPAGSTVTGYLTSATAASTYQTQAGMSSYLTTSAASSTYAPLASPTFTGTVTIPAGASISGYLDTATAASTYQTQAGMSSYLTTASASSTYAPQASPTLTGSIYANGSYRGNVTAVAALNIDCSLGNVFTKTINGASTFTVSNVPASRSYAFTLELTHTSGAITWFSGVVWPGGTAPTLTTGKVHLFMFFTDDGGTTWRASSLINY